MADSDFNVISVGDLADTLGCQSWRIGRLFETGVIPEPPRFSGRRAIPVALIPQIEAELKSRGWIRFKGPSQ